MRCKAWPIAVAIFAVATALAPSRASAADHVRATLLADVKQIVPGQPFHLGVMLDLDPGWHTYWLNPGDSGLATKIKLTLPKGFTAGELQFPTPRLIVDPGNVKMFGYTDKVMFIATVTPDKSLAPGDADLSATVSYLVCKDNCIPGQATVDLKLPLAAAGETAGEANKQLFADWTAQLPVPPQAFGFSEKFDPAKHSVDLTIFVNADKDKPLDVFPGPDDDVNVESEADIGDFDLQADFTIILHITPMAGRAIPASTLPVVLGYDDAGHHRRGVVVQIDLSKLKPADSKPPHG